MATYEFKLPDIGEGVTEGEVVQWLVKPGDVVEEDQPIVEVMTDKATVTITAPKAGTIVETRGKEGGVVAVHSVLVVFDLGGEAAAEPAPKTYDDGPAATAVGDIRETLPGMDVAPPTEAASSAYFADKPLATPATRKLARDLGIDLRSVPPTGPNGRVTKEDVLSVSDASSPETTSEPAPIAALARPEPPVRERMPPISLPSAASPPLSLPSVTGDERIPLRGIRKRIFDAMTRSKHTAAHFTFVEECDVTALKALRTRLRPSAEARGVKLTYLPFFVKASVAALRKHPMLNASFDEAKQEIVVRRNYHIGIASATDAGLIVPVVRDADRKSVLEIAAEIARLGDDAKSGKMKPQDMGGSTFTITSLGQQGGLFATPILNFPEVAILGIHQMKQKPVVRDGQIVIGDVMLLSLSFDHRIVDGHVGAAFAYELISYLEDPDKLFLEMT